MDALIVVDVQNDFLPDGPLAVPEGDAVIPVINSLVPQFQLIAATQDWHPADHGSFASQHPGCEPGDEIELHGLAQTLWPDHCIQGSSGADFAATLSPAAHETVFAKGTDTNVDSYSGFFDNGHRQDTGLGSFLKARQAGTLFVVGLATDYCVKFTALDAVQLAFDVVVVEDATRGVNLRPQDTSKALAELQSAGVRICRSTEILDTH